MTADAFRRTPLADRSSDLSAIGARLVPHLSQVALRLDPTDAFRSPFPLPVGPNTAEIVDDVDALWLGPDEWLLVGPPDAAADITSELETVLSEVNRSIVDVSANRVAIDLVGDRLHLLSHVCPIDLEPPAWIEGRCAQTLVGRGQALLHERPGSTRLFARPSFAGYVVDLLLAVRELSGDVRA